MGTEHKYTVTWDRSFSGWPTTLMIMQRRPGMLSTVDLEWDMGEKTIIRECPIEVMRRIVAMFDALPPVADGKQLEERE